MITDRLVDQVFQSGTRELASLRRIPSATYRLQFNRSFTFRDAQNIIPYLERLGVTDIYASPYLKAGPESTHGYDVVDHNSLNPAIGSDQDYESMVAELKRRGMGQVLDIVPNHMGIGPANRWWTDVLKNGPSSVFASFFDIDWDPVKPELKNRVQLPILGEQYGRVLENGEIELSYENGEFFVTYYDARFPIAPESSISLLRSQLDDLRRTLGADNDNLLELRSIITALSYLPERSERDPELVAERNREQEITKRRLDTLYRASPKVRKAINSTVAAYNGHKGDPASFDRLDALLADQAYRLSDWHAAVDEINYRRFFDINGLAAIRMENPRVFRLTHQLILRLLLAGKVTGLRVDHPDGLWDPLGYLRQLHRSYFLEFMRAQIGKMNHLTGADKLTLERRVLDLFEKLAASNPANTATKPIYVIMEKILQEGEHLPIDWPVYGTTGYDFINAVSRLFVDRSKSRAIQRVYAGFAGPFADLPNLVSNSKKMLMQVALASELGVLGRQLDRIAKRNRHYRDFTLNMLTFALREIIASLPVYRTYINAYTGIISDIDADRIETAVAEAIRRNPNTTPSIFHFIRDILLLKHTGDGTRGDDEQDSFVMRFQQTTGPVMAKALEDTVLYVYNPLVSLNEVGGDPGQFGISIPAFHRKNADRLKKWPHSLLATSTHDTKRGEDVRARINVLSEIPAEWAAALRRWKRMNRDKKSLVGGRYIPDHNEEYQLYQTLLGAWPFGPLSNPAHKRLVERVELYTLKALREAKVNTSWANPNARYEEAALEFVRSILSDSPGNLFLEDFRQLQRMIAHFGVFNSLGQTLLKITCPGVPDIYQGTETWDLNLVDPDNRHPVDYELRAKMLDALERRAGKPGADLLDIAKDLLASKEDGRIKLFLIYRSLNYRRQHRDIFDQGAYLPLKASAPRRDNVCCFIRGSRDAHVIVAVPALIRGATGGKVIAPLGDEVWKESVITLPRDPVADHYRNIFTGEIIDTIRQDEGSVLKLSDVFESFPVAMLERAVS